MAEETADVAAEQEITPEQFDGEDQESSKAESSPAEAESQDEAKETEAEAVEPTTEETETDSEEKPAEETETEPTKAEERKAQLNAEIRDLVRTRNELRDEVARKNSEVYQVASEDELVNQGMNPTDAKIEALRQQVEMSQYNDRVAEAQYTIEQSAQRVMTDFPQFNPNSEQYNEELSNEVAELMEANLEYDQNTGEITGSKVDPYKLYAKFAKVSQFGTTEGQLKGQQATEKMLANADVPSNKTNAQAPKKDPLDGFFDDL